MSKTPGYDNIGLEPGRSRGSVQEPMKRPRAAYTPEDLFEFRRKTCVGVNRFGNLG